MRWALRRQIVSVIILISFVSFCAFVIIYPTLNKAPTCFDGIQNGTETGVDCGGPSCARACTAQADQISVLWARSFRVVPGRYNAVAYLTNHNKNSAVEQIAYRFRFADVNNVYIGKREGTTFVPPGANFAVFEPGIDIGNSIPVYTTFEFTQAPTWLQVSDDLINQAKIFVSNIKLSDETTSPRLSATVRNNSLFLVSNLDVVTVLYDASGNAISASRTYLDQLPPLSSSDINFTWPEAFSAPVVEKEILPQYDIFTLRLQ